jgi:very-short-patch-repair endonuclease
MASPPVERARAMRKTMSPPELALWFQLRALRVRGWHFRRQAPEGPYFPDFICKRARLVIEVDGIHHSKAEQHQHDKERDAYLVKQGFRVLRFSASEVLNELDGVMAAILAELGDCDARVPAPKPQGRIGGRYGRLVRMGLRQRPASDS